MWESQWMIPIYTPIATAIRLILLIKIIIIIIISAAVGTHNTQLSLSLPSHEPLIWMYTRYSHAATPLHRHSPKQS